MGGNQPEARQDQQQEPAYGEASLWKYHLLKGVLGAYNEPMLNLHFMGPYLKNNLSSINSYELIF